MSGKKRDAAFYQAHKDDDELWGEPEEPAQAPRRSNLAATITVRFAAEEAEAIRRLAKESKQTYSDIVRQTVQAYTRPRYTIEAGIVHRPTVPQSDIRQSAEDVLQTTLRHYPDTVTSTSSVGLPTRR